METAKSLALAVLITFGLIWLLASQMPRSSSHPEAEAMQPEMLLPSANRVPGTATPAPRSELPEAAVDVEKLRKACVEEARSAGRPSVNPSSACTQYERAVAVAGDPTINVVAAPTYRSTRSREEAQPRREPGVAPTLIAYECGIHAYGTIAYRKCRAVEKKRLLDVCRQNTEWAERTGGEQRQRTKAIAAANCRVAELYEIVK